MSVLGNIKSPEGHTAWDYAQTIITLLHGLRQDIQEGRGDEPTSRRLPFSVTADGTGLGVVSFELPRGKRWEVFGYGLEFPSAVGEVRFYINEPFGTGLVWIHELTTNPNISGILDENLEVTEADLKLVVVVNASPGGVVSGNVRVRQYDGNPNKPKRAVG